MRPSNLTQGQRWTVSILVVVALLLSSSLTRLTGRLAELAAALPGPIPAAPAGTGGPPPAASPGSTARPTLGGRPSVTAPVVVPPVGLPPATGGATPTTPTTAVDPGTIDPNRPPCAYDATLQQARAAVEALDRLSGDSVPNGTIITILAAATGCREADPEILLLGGLIEIGSSLPDPLEGTELPPPPFVRIPPAVIAAVAPARSALEPVCGVIGTGSVVTSQVGPAYPFPVSAVSGITLFYALATCGQLLGHG